MSLSDFSIDTMSLLDDESFSEVSEEVPAWTKQKWRESLDKYKNHVI